MAKFHVIDSGCMSPEAIMEKDQELLDHLSEPILHLYDWEGPSLTYGYFLKPEKFLNIELLKYHGIRMARRPTGGGIVFHLTDLAFSVLVPSSHPSFSLNTMENYSWVNQKILQAIRPMLEKNATPTLCSCSQTLRPSFCMAEPTAFDILVQGKKIVGAAQRKTKHGFLHQGSILLTLPPADIMKEVLRDIKSFQQMEEMSFPLFEGNMTEVMHVRKQLLHSLVEVFCS